MSALGRQKERKREKRDKKNMVKEGKNDGPGNRNPPTPLAVHAGANRPLRYKKDSK